MQVYRFNEFTEKLDKNDNVVIAVGKSDYIDQIYLQLCGAVKKDKIYIFQNGRLLRFEEMWIQSHSSANGEDCYILKLIGVGILPQKGVYVDAGAYNPFRFSNTLLLYQNGWRGLNIDANTDKIELFKIFRPDDANVVSGIGEKKGTLNYYVFENNQTANTFDDKVAKILAKERKLKEVRKIPVETLEKIIDDAGIDNIDYLNVDLEHFDFQAICSLNIERFRPSLISIESDSINISEHLESQVHKFLVDNHYKFTSFMWNTAFYMVVEM